MIGKNYYNLEKLKVLLLGLLLQINHLVYLHRHFIHYLIHRLVHLHVCPLQCLVHLLHLHRQRLQSSHPRRCFIHAERLNQRNGIICNKWNPYSQNTGMPFIICCHMKNDFLLTLNEYSIIDVHLYLSIIIDFKNVLIFYKR